SAGCRYRAKACLPPLARSTADWEEPAMARFNFLVNGAPVDIEVDPSTPLLWVLRDHLGLTGTKFGCGAALCGACTVHVNGEAVRSCAYAIDAINGKNITTIEGLRGRHKLQRAWIEQQVPQCGYCQPGMIMAAAALLRR